MSLLTLLIAFDLSAQDEKRKPKESAFLPFYFSTDTLGSTVGVAGVVKGVGQPQALLFGMGMYSDKDSYIGFLAAYNYALSEQWLFGSQLYNARWNENSYYLRELGDNDSDDKSEGIETDGLEDRYEMSFRYILPWGNVQRKGLAAVFQQNREVRSGSPKETGISSIIFTPFYSSRELEDLNEKEQATGLGITFDWDNRDNVRNPTQGSHTAFDVTVGTETLGDGDPWVKLELESGHYFDLGSLGSLFDKQVFAFDVYTADTPTWDDHHSTKNPPENEQVRLGGLYRLRSYTAGRYHGRSAMHYSAEYRVMPRWQPLSDIPVINYYDLPWWQWVAFADVGRVAEEYDLKELHTDMQWSLGGALRFQVEGIVVRTEVARGSNESLFRVMINQPF